jgi:Ca2+-binding EF-hand superfamily protein
VEPSGNALLLCSFMELATAPTQFSSRMAQDMLTKSFKEFDRNRNGFLDLDEVRRLLQRVSLMDACRRGCRSGPMDPMALTWSPA